MLPLHPGNPPPPTHRFTLWSRRVTRRRVTPWAIERCWEIGASVLADDPALEILVLPPDERPYLT